MRLSGFSILLSAFQFVTLTVRKQRGISNQRRVRILNDIAPLYSRGLSYLEISKRLGISDRQIAKDVELLKQHWNESLPEQLEDARGDLVNKHHAIYAECWSAYEETKVAKFLELASKELECLGRLLGQGGAGLNLQINQNSVNISAEAVADLFKPLAASDYQAMVATRALPTPEAGTDVSQYETPQEQQGLDRADDTLVAVDLCPTSADPCPDQLIEPQYQQADPKPTALEADWPIVIDSQACAPAIDADEQDSQLPSQRNIKHPRQ